MMELLTYEWHNTAESTYAGPASVAMLSEALVSRIHFRRLGRVFPILRGACKTGPESTHRSEEKYEVNHIRRGGASRRGRFMMWLCPKLSTPIATAARFRLPPPLTGTQDSAFRFYAPP